MVDLPVLERRRETEPKKGGAGCEARAERTAAERPGQTLKEAQPYERMEVRA
jgi:hypothetical protein